MLSLSLYKLFLSLGHFPGSSQAHTLHLKMNEGGKSRPGDPSFRPEDTVISTTEVQRSKGPSCQIAGSHLPSMAASISEQQLLYLGKAIHVKCLGTCGLQTQFKSSSKIGKYKHNLCSLKQKSLGYSPPLSSLNPLRTSPGNWM